MGRVRPSAGWLRVPSARMLLALRRSRRPIAVSAATYVISLGAGLALATAGWSPAVGQRDAIVGGAQLSPITIADRQGNHLRAALLDFGSNVILGALPTSVMGLSVIGPFPIAAYRGWVGGIVSIDSRHRSRLATPSDALYYLVTVALQLIGYVLTMAAGLHVGLAAWRYRSSEAVRSVVGLRIPRSTWGDSCVLYLLALPIFLVGSLWEFFA